MSAGVYTTNSPEACRYLASDCKAQIIVVEDEVYLDKFLAVKRFLPDIKVTTLNCTKCLTLTVNALNILNVFAFISLGPTVVYCVLAFVL